MTNLTVLEKVDDKLQNQIKKSAISFLETKFQDTFNGSMPAPHECNQFSRQSLAFEFKEKQSGLIELCGEQYSKDELAEQLEILIDLLFPLAYYKTYASKHMEWSHLQRYYQGIQMFNGMDYLFLENYSHEEDLRIDMKCYTIENNRYEEVSDEDMLELCNLCNQYDYYLNNADLLDPLIVKVLINHLREGKIPKERLGGMYPASMFLEPVPDDDWEYVYYID